jgi:hypothetical protein
MARNLCKWKVCCDFVPNSLTDSLFGTALGMQKVQSHALIYIHVKEQRRTPAHVQAAAGTGTKDLRIRAAQNNLPHIARLLQYIGNYKTLSSLW